MSGHTVPQAALGGFILFFGFLAFNGGSQAAIASAGDADTVALAIVNTVIGGAAGAITAMIIKRLGYADKYWSLLFTINGGLTGMVALCAGCNVVHPYAAFVIGIIAGIAYVAWSTLVVKLKIDDPLDAVAVHLGGGIWGVLSAPIFNKDSGILYDGGLLSFRGFGWNLLGVIVIMIWSGSLAFILFLAMNLIGVLRVDKDIELKGLDIPKHGEPAYPLDSYGDGWSEQPDPVKTIPFVHKSTSQLNLAHLQNGSSNPKEKGIDNPAVIVPVESPNTNSDTAF